MKIFNNHRDAYMTAKSLCYHWVAMDSNGQWWAFDSEPIIIGEQDIWFSHINDRFEHIGNMDPTEEHWPSTKLEVKRWLKRKA